MADSSPTQVQPMRKSRSGCKLIIKRVNNKITSYFPPSPAQDDPTDEDPEDLKLEEVHRDCSTLEITGKEDKSEVVEPDIPAIPTPDTTPTKDKKGAPTESVPHSPHTITLVEDLSSEDIEESKENRIQNHSKQINISEDDKRLCDSPKPTQAKQIKANPTPGKDGTLRGRGRAGRGRPKKAGKQKSAAPSQVKEAKTSSKPAPKDQTTQQNQLLTDFFPVRRSSRKTTTDIKKERQADLEKAIKEECTDGLKVVQIPDKGRGVIATKAFMKGDFVVEYSGDLISVAKAKDREKKYQSNPDFGCYMYYFTHNNNSYCIDATAESGKLGRLLNHSCKTPNCSTKVVPIDGHPYLILVANRDIKVHEELIYDYGDRSKESLAAHPWLAL